MKDPLPMNTKTIKTFDPSSMHQLLLDFPFQAEDAVRIGQKSNVKIAAGRVENIVLTGLGGSAIGGDLLRSYLAEELEVPFLINRHYILPAFVNAKSLVVVSSYSGNTEETIAAHREAVKRSAQVVCISSNGATSTMAAKNRLPLITIPRGYPPRAALGYSFFAPLVMLAKTGLVRSRQRDISETLTLLKKKARIYGSFTSSNPALRLAKKLHGTLPVIYSAADRFDVVNLRWRGQIAENAKMLAFGHVIPEMNHNELVGWNVPKELMKKMTVVILRDRGDHPRVQLRMDITGEVVSAYAGGVIDVTSEGTSLLARMFSLIYLGDWVSFYLAMLNRVDPTPVKVIDMLKKKLAAVS
jgi:glucose/mannose-6-phosphate isomerase